MTTGYVPPIPDYDFVTRTLAVGSRVGPKGLPVLQGDGITHLLAVDSHPTFEEAAGFGITIFSHPFRDDLQVKPPSVLLPLAQQAMEALSRPGSVLLVTCGAGMYRAPMVALLILRLLGHSQEDARDMISSSRWGVAFPRAYLESVEQTVAQWAQGEVASGPMARAAD